MILFFFFTGLSAAEFADCVQQYLLRQQASMIAVENAAVANAVAVNAAVENAAAANVAAENAAAENAAARANSESPARASSSATPPSDAEAPQQQQQQEQQEQQEEQEDPVELRNGEDDDVPPAGDLAEVEPQNEALDLR